MTRICTKARYWARWASKVSPTASPTMLSSCSWPAKKMTFLMFVMASTMRPVSCALASLWAAPRCAMCRPNAAVTPR